jgi:putative redox protein
VSAGNTRAIRLEWLGDGMRFRGGGTEPATPAVEIDGDGKAGPSPMITLLLAAAGCTGSDVVSILKKMRVELRRCVIDLRGTRREEEPRRYVALHYRYVLSGDGLDRVKAERAVKLSIEKYCSVLHTLAPDLAVSYDIVVE